MKTIKMEVRFKEPLIIKSDKPHRLILGNYIIDCNNDIVCNEIKDIGNNEYMILDSYGRDYKKITKEEILTHKNYFHIHYYMEFEQVK